MLLAPGATGVAVEEARQPRLSEPLYGIGAGVAGGEEAQRGLVGEVGAEGRKPGRPENLKQRVEPGQRRRAPLDERLAQPGRATQGLPRPEAVLVVQPLRVQQRQSREQARVDAVALGVLAVVGTQVRRPFRRHQHDARAAAAKPSGERYPGVARGLHDHQHVGRLGLLRQHRPEPLEILRSGAKGVAGPDELPGLVRQARLVRGPTRDIDP